MLFQRATTALELEKTPTCSTETNFGWFCYKLLKKLCWEKKPGTFLLFIISFLVIYLFF